MAAYNSSYTGAQIDTAVNTTQNLTSTINAAITAAKLAMFPIGSIYMTIGNTNPGSFIGGTWVQIQDTFLLAAGSTYTAGDTGGEATHTLTTDEMPEHKHRIREEFGNTASSSYPPNVSYSYISGNSSSTKSWQGDPIENTGGGLAHNNMPPYLVVYIWKRTA